MTKHVLFLEGNASLAIEAVRLAHDLGHLVTFVTCDLDHYTHGKLAHSALDHADRIVELDRTDDYDSLLAAILRIHADCPIDAILTFNELHIALSARLADHLGLRHLSPTAASRSRDKIAMRDCLARAAVPQPAYQPVSCLAGARRFAERCGYPLIMKPADGSGSVNTRLIENAGELAEHLALLQSAADYRLHVPASKRALCEEYVRGELISVETLTYGGCHQVLGITDRILGGFPSFVELGGCFPASPVDRDQAIATALAALDAIELDFGPAHTELVHGEHGWQIIEINARLVGGFVPAMIDATLHRQIMLDVVRLHLGEPIAPIGDPDGVATLRALHSPVAGTIARIDPSPASTGADVLLYMIHRRCGDRVHPVASNHDRLGCVAVWGATEAASRQLAERILGETRFVIGV